MRRAIIVVKNEVAVNSNLDAKIIDKIGGDYTFTDSVLSATGKAPSTHTWCSWLLTDTDFTKLEGLFKGNSPNRRFYDGDKLTPEQVLADTGLKIVYTPA